MLSQFNFKAPEIKVFGFQLLPVRVKGKVSTVDLVGVRLKHFNRGGVAGK
jgi:hypothetical protein